MSLLEVTDIHTYYGESHILEGVSLGTIHMFEGSAASLGRFAPRMEAFACPFAWKSPEALAKAANI